MDKLAYILLSIFIFAFGIGTIILVLEMDQRRQDEGIIKNLHIKKAPKKSRWGRAIRRLNKKGEKKEERYRRKYEKYSSLIKKEYRRLEG